MGLGVGVFFGCICCKRRQMALGYLLLGSYWLSLQRAPSKGSLQTSPLLAVSGATRSLLILALGPYSEERAQVSP